MRLLTVSQLASGLRLVGVIIEPRIHYAWEYCVRNVILHLENNGHLLHLLVCDHNELYARRLLQDAKTLEFHNLPKEFTSYISAYISIHNRFLTSPSLWNQLLKASDIV